MRPVHPAICWWGIPTYHGQNSESFALRHADSDLHNIVDLRHGRCSFPRQCGTAKKVFRQSFGFHIILVAIRYLQPVASSVKLSRVATAVKNFIQRASHVRRLLDQARALLLPRVEVEMTGAYRILFGSKSRPRTKDSRITAAHRPALDLCRENGKMKRIGQEKRLEVEHLLLIGGKTE